ncbi:hypothetical protein GT347_21835 [Xylophilus rhododendri]|uniref:CpXC domain-containing protein n=1 Tax=Xylophilus rhododendri TaxID=2697032 RepID=A0A857JCH6_9BURK|nr:CpXC domain-containing protein [Xylophilus rhododendri]QHJ00386.1 hypothetical protein GT347_21835 [Xylophilus rhododendri]
MSIIRTTPIPCPACGGAVDFPLVHSVNADRRPDLREDILSTVFQRQACPNCGTEFRVAPEFNYLDLGRRQWIAAWPADRMGDWSAVAERARQAFEQAFGGGAPASARELGKGLRCRLTFGWAALREKVFIAGAGLDDVTVELAKMALIRDSRQPPLGSAALRLLAIQDARLVFGWQDLQDESATELIEVDAQLLAEIEAEGEWAELRQRLSSEMFVDVLRLFLPTPELQS